MKAQTTCLPLKKVVYKDFKNFNETAFLEDVSSLGKVMTETKIMNFFHTSFKVWLINTHPLKPKLSAEVTFLFSKQNFKKRNL